MKKIALGFAFAMLSTSNLWAMGTSKYLIGLGYFSQNSLGHTTTKDTGAAWMIKNSEPPRPSMIFKNSLALLLPLLAWALLRFRKSQQLQASHFKAWHSAE